MHCLSLHYKGSYDILKLQCRIVVTSSLAGKLGAPGLGSYCGSKYALHGWFETLRIEGYSHNINVTMVCPGPVFSEILMHAFTDTKEKDVPI